MIYRLTTAARQGLRGILGYVQDEFGDDVAQRVLGELIQAFELLAESPGIGRVREDLTDREEVRFWSVPPTLIAYRAQEGVVQVLFVERGERDWLNQNWSRIEDD